MAEINGIVNVYKEKGFTSHDVVAKLRKILKIKKIGHTGTLDPDATGVLPVCIGNATKICDLIMEKKKEYIADIKFGIQTDTGDLSGKIIAKNEGEIKLDKKKFINACNSFVGEYDQIPPMYSAIKINGKKLYELARENIEVERKSRCVNIYDIEILGCGSNTAKIKVLCSKGTYIRTLCEDIGKKLSLYAVMSELVRTRSGYFYIEDALKLSEIERKVLDNTLDEIIIKPDFVLKKNEKLVLKEEFEKIMLNGNPLFTDMFINAPGKFEEGKCYRIYTFNEEFKALYKTDSDYKIKPEKMFL